MLGVPIDQEVSALGLWSQLANKVANALLYWFWNSVSRIFTTASRQGGSFLVDEIRGKLASAELDNAVLLRWGHDASFEMVNHRLTNDYGCCTQGLAYPRDKAEDLLHWDDGAPRIGLRGSSIEQYADENDELCWALTPSVLQHIGPKTLKDVVKMAKKQVLITHRVKSYPFELNDAEELRREHFVAAGDGT
ncbi:uncharacterized protein LTR77_007116 [Saxophila tyrrhenica]|uniref:Uncharacterized protein n=1 Tax=Saxophila tyrrhenica TaxID=1690608 RepID=A0AAV9P7L8_9PEZI|nr:hypothetical protein LTR77_007116 [Saxophila tyrrhenica]